MGRLMRSARSLSLLVATVAAWLSGAAQASASPEDLFGYGARTSGMGATGAAHARGYESAFHNPALASTIREHALTLGYGGAVFDLEAVGDGLPGRVSEPAARGLYIGAGAPIPFGGKLEDRVGVALAFYTPSDVIVRGRVLYPEAPQFPLLGPRSQSLTIRGGLGADIGWGLRVGAGFAALAEIVGTVVARTDATGRVGTRVDNQLVATYAPVLGATFDVPRSSLRVGLVYRGQLDARFAIVIDGSKLTSLTIPLFNISGVAQYDPSQVALEIAHERDRLVLAAQLVYKKWSDFPGILEPTVVCTDGGPGACGLSPPVVGWRDTGAVRVGAERGLALAPGLVLRGRGGGFVETSALPGDVAGSEAFDVAAQQVVSVPTRYFDAARVAFTAGLGVSLGGPERGGGSAEGEGQGGPTRGLPVDLDVYAQHHVLLPRTVRSSSVEGAPLTSGEVSGNVTVFGLTASVRF